MFFSVPTSPSIRAPWIIGTVAFLGVALSHLEHSSARRNPDTSTTVIGDSQSSSSFASSFSTLSPTDALVEWFNANGGYLHESVEIRRQNHEDSTSPYGIFAKRDLEKGETVLKIPSSLYFQLDEKDVSPEVPYSPHDSIEVQQAKELKAMEAYYNNTCKLALKLRDEMASYQQDPSSSKFAPFMRYLDETQPRGQIPAAYSSRAKAILREMQGKRSAEEIHRQTRSWYPGDSLFHPLVDWIDEDFVQKGCINEGDDGAYHAVALTIQRGYDIELIPIWDMFNHDNNALNLASNSIHDEEGFQVWTMETIGKGQELFVSYNFCFDCLDDGSGDDWGLPGIFRDFGFVEDYPQYWPFLDQNVYALIEELHQVPNGQPTYHARFFRTGISSGDSSVAYGPTVETLKFFVSQLNRLRHLNIEEQVKGLTAENERYMITRYYRSLMTAMETIVASVNNVDRDGRVEAVLERG